MKKGESRSWSRRRFLGQTGAAAVAAGFPAIVPARVFGTMAPSNRIHVGAIGTGRISRGHDMPGVWKYANVQIVAVCDVDSRRVEDARTLVNTHYSQKLGKSWDGVRGYADYRDILSDQSVDAVLVSTPDHWHAPIAIHAVQASKDVYLQKPASLTIAEGRLLSNAVHQSGRIFQIGSQQRSAPQFRRAAELVGLPGDPSGEEEPEMPTPKNLDYERWLGSTPCVYYTEKRVHPQAGYDRPGWLRCEQFGAGMITGWGSHHVDCAHWAMDTEHTGPVEISGTAEFPSKGLWNVHGAFRTEATYANGVRMIISGEFPNGIRFEGTEGWIFVSRGNEKVTPSDPVAKLQDAQALSASDPKILGSVIGPDGIHLYESHDHHGNWIECIRSRQPSITPVEVAHRSCSACLLHHIAMKTRRTLRWDPTRERFANDDEANSMLARAQRWPYVIN
jgi:predicted dehydrogenase